MTVVAVRDLDLRHLQALDAVASAGTFGRAAQRLGYTQSAVSQQIAALERVVGEPLFDRPGGPRPPALTPLGKVLAEHARALLEHAEEVATEVRRFRAGATGRIDIGTFQSISTAVLPGLLGRFRAELPSIEVGLQEDDHQEVLVAGVVEGRLEVSFLVGPPPEPLDGVELFVDPFVVVARPEDVGAAAVPAEVLRRTPLIGQQDNACSRLVETGLRGIGVEPDYVFRTSDNGAVTSMVRAGMGMAVLPLLAVDEEDPRTVVRPVHPPIPDRHVHLAWQRDRTLSPAARRFVDLAVDGTAHLRDPARRELLATPSAA